MPAERGASLRKKLYHGEAPVCFVRVAQPLIPTSRFRPPGRSLLIRSVDGDCPPATGLGSDGNLIWGNPNFDSRVLLSLKSRPCAFREFCRLRLPAKLGASLRKRLPRGQPPLFSCLAHPLIFIAPPWPRPFAFRSFRRWRVPTNRGASLQETLYRVEASICFVCVAQPLVPTSRFWAPPFAFRSFCRCRVPADQGHNLRKALYRGAATIAFACVAQPLISTARFRPRSFPFLSSCR